MVSAHAAVSHSAERHMVIGDLYDDIVNASAAKRDFGNQFFRSSLVAREYVTCKGFTSLIDFSCKIVNILIFCYRKKRTENLILHYFIIKAGIGEDGGGDSQFCIISLSADHIGSGSGINEIAKPPVMNFIDDVGEGFIF